MTKQKRYDINYSQSPDFWQDDHGEPAMLPAVRNNFVAPLPVEHKPAQEIVQAYPVAIVPHSPSHTTSIELSTTYTDRAEGFRISTLPMSIMAGVLSGIVAVVGFGVPVLSLAILSWIFTASCLAWLIAYIWHTLISPDGVALIHTLLGWLFLFTEQRHRHRGRK